MLLVLLVLPVLLVLLVLLLILKNLAEHQRKYSAPALSTAEQISLMNFSFTFKRIP
jgi:hypothetical protein